MMIVGQLTWKAIAMQLNCTKFIPVITGSQPEHAI
jgi:hypothetical protein